MYFRNIIFPKQGRINRKKNAERSPNWAKEDHQKKKKKRQKRRRRRQERRKEGWGRGGETNKNEKKNQA